MAKPLRARAKGWWHHREVNAATTIRRTFVFFGPLDHFDQSCGNDEAANLLRRARMSLIRDFASKSGRLADMREFAQA